MRCLVDVRSSMAVLSLNWSHIAQSRHQFVPLSIHIQVSLLGADYGSPFIYARIVLPEWPSRTTLPTFPLYMLMRSSTLYSSERFSRSEWLLFSSINLQLLSEERDACNPAPFCSFLCDIRPFFISCLLKNSLLIADFVSYRSQQTQWESWGRPSNAHSNRESKMPFSIWESWVI